MHLLSLLLAAALLSVAVAQAPVGGGSDPGPFIVPPDSAIFRNRTRRNCRSFFREDDGTCTTDSTNEAKVLGSTGRPQFSYFGRATSMTRFSTQKSPREISNVVFAQSRSILNECGVSEMAVFFGQFLDHTFAASPESHESFPIPKSSKPDPTGNGFLNDLGEPRFPFFRSERVLVRTKDNIERASNSLTSATDLVNVYGPTKERNSALRTGPFPASTKGEMKVDKSKPAFGDLLPRNTERLNNAPTARDRTLFLAGDHRSNEHPILTSIHTLFVREHNRLAKELKANTTFSRLNDQNIYELAKRINEIQFQKIIFEEWFPRITGRTLGPYKGYNPKTDPTISLAFSTAAFRVGHTFVGPKVNFVEEGSTTPSDKSLDLSDAFFNAVGPITSNGIDGFLRGAMLSQAQEVDTQVVDGLRNSLFRDVPHLDGNLDLVSLNLQRGRDHALPNYNLLRHRFFTTKAICFEQISTDATVVDKLKKVYKNPGRVEAFVGLLAEDHVPGSSFGPTLFNLWRAEFRRLRAGDRFFFRNKATIPREIRDYPRVMRVLDDSRFEVFRQLILDNTGIVASELPNKMFKIDGVSCGKFKEVPADLLLSCPSR